MYKRQLLLFTLPGLVGLCLIAEPMISLFLTAEYLQYGVELFYIIALSLFFLNCRAHYVDHGLQFTLNTRLLPIITGVSIVINIGLLVVLIEPYGLYGAAYASLITNVLTLILSFVVSRYKGYQYKLSSDIFKVISASVAMGGCMLVLKSMLNDYSTIMQLGALIVAGGISYGIANLVLNTVNSRSYISKVLGK